MEKKMKYLQTDLYHNFNCIGGECEESCCAADWNIIIDNETYQKYESMDDTTKHWIYKNIEICEDGSYKINMDSNGRCPFLNENNLCNIILKTSEDYISQVCQTYPRKITQYNDIEFYTVSTSCPEAARLLVERDTPIKFYTGENEKKYKEGKNLELFQALLNGYETSVEILQNNKLSLSEKYVYLLLLVEEIHAVIEKKEFDKISLILEKFKSEKNRKAMIKNVDNIFSMKLNQWTTVSLLLNILLASEIEEKEWLYSNVVEALKTFNGSTYNIWKDKYKKIEIIQEKENLAVQFIFEYFMDALNNKSLYKSLAKMYVMLTYIEIFEVLFYKKKGKLSAEDRIKIITEVSRIMEHTVILDCICDEFMEENPTLNLIRLLNCIL